MHLGLQPQVLVPERVSTVIETYPTATGSPASRPKEDEVGISIDVPMINDNQR